MGEANPPPPQAGGVVWGCLPLPPQDLGLGGLLLLTPPDLAVGIRAPSASLQDPVVGAGVLPPPPQDPEVGGGRCAHPYPKILGLGWR